MRTGPRGTGDRGGCPRPVDDTLPRLFGLSRGQEAFATADTTWWRWEPGMGRCQKGEVCVCVCVYVRVCACAHVCVCMHTHVLDGRRNSII